MCPRKNWFNWKYNQEERRKYIKRTKNEEVKSIPEQVTNNKKKKSKGDPICLTWCQFLTVQSPHLASLIGSATLSEMT